MNFEGKEAPKVQEGKNHVTIGGFKYGLNPDNGTIWVAPKPAREYRSRNRRKQRLVNTNMLEAAARLTKPEQPLLPGHRDLPFGIEGVEIYRDGIGSDPKSYRYRIVFDARRINYLSRDKISISIPQKDKMGIMELHGPSELWDVHRSMDGFAVLELDGLLACYLDIEHVLLQATRNKSTKKTRRQSVFEGLYSQERGLPDNTSEMNFTYEEQAKILEALGYVAPKVEIHVNGEGSYYTMDAQGLPAEPREQGNTPIRITDYDEMTGYRNVVPTYARKYSEFHESQLCQECPDEPVKFVWSSIGICDKCAGTAVVRRKYGR